MPTQDLNSGSGATSKNQVNDIPASAKGFSEFENSVMHPSELPPRAEQKVADSKVARWHASHWNRGYTDMPIWGQTNDEIPSAETSSGHALRSSEDADANYKHISSKQRQDDDNLDSERRIRSKVDQLGGIRDSIKFIRPGHSRAIRPTSGKDRHSKVNTSKGPRDRRVRLSVPTAVQFYDVQDRLGYDQPSKAVEWLMKNAKAAIDELWQLPFTPSIESPSKTTSVADSSFQESSHDQLSSTSSSFNDILNPPAPTSVLRSISQFERDRNQGRNIIQEYGGQSRNEKGDSKQIITGTSIGENEEHTTENLNSNVLAELNNESKLGEVKKPAEENHIMIISLNSSTCKTDSSSASASFRGHQSHQSSPRFNASHFYTRDLQHPLITSAALDPPQPWHVILNGSRHQERSEDLETLPQSQTNKLNQGAYPQYFDYSYAKCHQSAEEAKFQNPFLKAGNNSQVSTGFDHKHGTVSENNFSVSQNNMCSCTKTCTRVISSYREDNAMFRTPSTSQFCPVTNSATRTPAMHFVSDRTFKHPTINALLNSSIPSTLSGADTSRSLKQNVYLEELTKQQDHVIRSPKWLSGSDPNQNAFLNIPSRINTITSSIYPPYSPNDVAEDVPAIAGTLSSSKNSNSFSHIGHNVLQSSEDTSPSPLILRSQIPARIQGFDELHDVMERTPQ